ncbi:hypothetical protein EMPG_11707 [Blastomyces silverae]|uniref:Uncharacterized protein n=1 Tax=Blastomyces silverae TaxID=2060906 RepID=A0A0H1BQG8_9EURO|nr:hypothetical protein EMPG_11707 [Blastomyces silverae]
MRPKQPATVPGGVKSEAAAITGVNCNITKNGIAHLANAIAQARLILRIEHGQHSHRHHYGPHSSLHKRPTGKSFMANDGGPTAFPVVATS